MKKLMAIFLACLAASVQAETKIWMGGDGNFSAPGLWSDATAPVSGDDVVISNGAVTVTAADTFGGLASIALGEGGTIVCAEPVATGAAVTFSSNSTLQVSAGELLFHGFASGKGFTKAGNGTVRFSGGNGTFVAWLPGLREGQLSGAFNLTSPNTGTLVSGPLTMANTTWPAGYTATTFVYTGEIYLDGSFYAFAENFDDNAYLKINGITVLSNMVYNVTSSNTLQLAAGWYPVELRVGNNSGGGGSLNVVGTGGGIAWKKGSGAWQVLRDFDGGGFLRSPGKLAASFSEGIILNAGTVVVSTDIAADTINSGPVNYLGEIALNAGTLILSNAVCQATALTSGVATALLRLDAAKLTLTNESDCTFIGKTAGLGTLVKDGAGRLQWEARSQTHYAHAATIVNNGVIALGSSATWMGDYSFNTFTVNAPATLETLVNGGSQFASLWGDGTLTNRGSTGGPFQLRIMVGPCEFSGRILGYIRYYSQGEVALTGTNSTFGGNFAIHSSGGPGITGAKKIGLKNQPSSIGSSTTVDIRENGGTFQYLGTGETTDKDFSFWPSGNRAVVNGGPYGGATFNGGWSGASAGRLNRLALIGTNAVPCVFNGAYAEATQNGTNYSTYIAKEGSSTWVFKHHANRLNRGVVDVRDGTLQFESIAEVGQVCSLGKSDLLFADVLNANTNGLGVPYAFSLGTASTVGTLEYIGASPATSGSRKLVLQGNGRLKSDSASLKFSGGIQSLTAGAKTLFIAGSATNTLGSVSDGAGTVGVTKEGTGTWILPVTNSFSGPLEVKAGQMVLDKRGYAYYRFNMLQRCYGVLTGDTNVEFTELALYSADGVRRNLNLVKNGTNNLSGLNPGQFCPMGNYPTYPSRNDINLFDGIISSQWTVNTYGFLPNTPVSLVMRLAEGTPAITGYDLQYWNADTNRYLSGWSVEGSRDGSTWDTLHSVMNFVPVPPAVIGAAGVKWWYSTGTITPGNGFGVADGRLMVAQLKADVQVSVAAGAALTLLGGPEPLGALSVDYDAGGGTINELSLAQTGRIDLTGSSIQGLNFAVPLTIGALTNPEALKNWSLYINGQLIQGAVLRWDVATSTLRVAPLGTSIMFN